LKVAKVLADAAPLVVPSPTETARVESVARSVLSRTRRAAAVYPQTRGVLLGGSFAKGTWLPKHVDLDIFVKFDPSTSDQEFGRLGLEIGAAATWGYLRGKKFAQHPYTEATVDGIRVNVVPCFDVTKGAWKSAADRSPFHVNLVKRLSDEKKTEVRLLKTFMNAVGVYGAEIQRQGFSGYVAEVLIMKLGGIEQVLQWFANYTAPAKERAFSLPDPIDEGRDLGTAVSGESLGRMILACREFLRRPNVAFLRRMPGKFHPALVDHVVALVFNHKAVSEDTLWGELRRTSRHVVRHLEVLDFKVARHIAASDNKERSAILLVPEFDHLPTVEQREGPTVDRRKDVEAFIAANAKDSKLIWIDEDVRVRILRPRKYTSLEDLLLAVAKGKAGPVGASKELEAGMRKSARVLRGRPLARAASTSKWLQDGIREITSDALGTR
jgi:tRNA nucleotidyltransferase (CCA-adding enzyme)